MDLLLWRHAEAQQGGDDLQRPLTRRGEKQAMAVASWIRAHQPEHLRILVSPATRCQQTVMALGLRFETIPKLAPDGQVADLIAAAAWPTGISPVLIVGHQPTLGRVISMLLVQQSANMAIKKGALWWLSRRIRGEEAQTVLRCVMSPEFLT